MTEPTLHDRLHAAWVLRQTDIDGLIATSEAALLEAEAAQDTACIADALRNLSWAGARQGRSSDILAQTLRAQVLYEALGDPVGLAYIQEILSGVFINLDDYGEALRAGFQAVRLYREALPDASMAYVYAKIGMAYAYLEDSEQALVNFRQGLAQAQQHADRVAELDARNSIGYMLFQLGRYEEALVPCQAAVALARQYGQPYHFGYILHSLGAVYLALGDAAQAEACFKEGLAGSRAANHEIHASGNLRGLADVYQQQGRLDEALACLNEALTCGASHSSVLEHAQVHKQLSAVYEAQGDLAATLHHYKLYSTMQQRISQTQIDQRLKGQQIVHDLELARQETANERQKNRLLQQQISLHEQQITELDAYAHTVAHDLRNPINVIQGFSEILMEDLGPQLDSLQCQYLESIQTTALKMQQIVDELLRLSSQRQQQVMPQPVEMAGVFEEARRRQASLIDKYEAEVSIEAPLLPALGYSAWLEEVWDNYLSNAIKYGGTPPRVVVGSARQDGMVCYWAQDNGAGIPAAQQARLFQEGERLDASGPEGHGLGLSIVKRIVQRLGGTVGVTSTGVPGEGASFFFTLPAVPD